MYGESFGTGTLSSLLVDTAERVRGDIDNGVPTKEILEDARNLMEGSMVLYTGLLVWAYEDEQGSRA